MTERDHAGGGGLTGATGDLTFEENDRPFVTGEAREVSDPERQADVTKGQAGNQASPSPRSGGATQIGGDEVTGGRGAPLAHGAVEQAEPDVVLGW